MVKVGDKIRVLVDHANYADVKAGDIFTVADVHSNGWITTEGVLNWGFSPSNFEVISEEPPKKIQKDGYEYELVGPVKPEWLVDGVWVVHKSTGKLYQLIEGENEFSLRSGVGILTPKNIETIVQFYRPHEDYDWEWGDWAMYEGKRVFVMGNDGDAVKISHPNLSLAGCFSQWVGYDDITPTF